jgi:putative ABC transport system permease protein
MADPQRLPAQGAEHAPAWRRYVRFFGPRIVADLDDELRFHVEMRVRDFMARGMSETEARAATALRLGDLADARGECVTIANRTQRRMTRAQILDAFGQDVKFALRSLGRQKAWTAIAVLTLALGIGANSAMFSVLNRVLLNPLPYPDADRVVIVYQEPSQGNTSGHTVMVTPMGRLVAAWRSTARSFETLEPYRTTDVTLQRQGETPRVAHSASVLPSFARFSGQHPLVGRMFTASEAKGEANVALLSERMWRSEFGSDASLLGRAISINDKPVTIIGVMPAEFQLPERRQTAVDVWLPLDLLKADDDGLFTVGRLRPEATRAEAAAELDSISSRHPAGATSARYKAKLAGPAEMVGFQDSLILLAVAVALVLLIACANVAHLLLARASTRQREMAIRTALGAGTERLFRQLVTESMILSMAGCVGGLAIGAAGLRLLIAARPENLAELSVARMDWTTFMVALVLSVITGIVFGVIGAVQASRHSNHEMLKAGSLTASAGRSPGRLRGLLVVTEMALCTTLLVAATLLFRSVSHLQTQDAGFDATGLYSLHVQLAEDRYTTKAAKLAFVSELKTRARGIPGVQAITVAASPPPQVAMLIGALQLEGQPEPPAGQTAFIKFNGVEPEYFAVMRMRIVEGSTFTDTTSAAAQVLINEGMARKHWPGQSPVGRTLRVVYDGKGDWKTIVGVVADAHTQGLTSEASDPMLYIPGPGFFDPALVVRTTGDARMIPALSGIAMSLDARLPPPAVTSIADAMQKSIAQPRFTMFLLMIFTLVAVGLAAVGLYGVLAYSVAQRTREIGIRLTLGASRSTVAKSVLTHALVLAGLGGVIGLVAARWGVKLVSSMLYGVQQTDAPSFAVGAAILALVALLACLVPVRRALAVDPLIAMRAD